MYVAMALPLEEDDMFDKFGELSTLGVGGNIDNDTVGDDGVDVSTVCSVPY